MDRGGLTKGFEGNRDDARRALHRLFMRHWWQVVEAQQAMGYGPDAPKLPEFPQELCGLTCGAKTRNGTPCKLTALEDNGRCKFHGGRSTGPKTPEGKARAAFIGLVLKRKRPGTGPGGEV